ncbi:MAG: DUF748 domain-containing protein [Bacteriovorax sp.]|nr:DUF748 domain-containing protein [Bacteriovorax sp.]
MKNFYKEKKIYIPVIIVAVLIVFRILLPQILLYEANKYLGEFSPTYSLHMKDLDISILRGAYSFEDVTGKLKGEEKTFLTISDVDVSIAWRHIFRGKVVTDIEAKNVDFLFLKDMSKLNPPKKEAVDVKDTLFPVKIETVDLKNARIVFEEYPALSDESRLKIEKINGRITNLTPDEQNKISNFNLGASIQGSSELVFIGSLNLLQKPVLWDVDVEMKDFNLTSLNAVLKRNLPLTFTKGRMDFFAEAQNDKSGKMKGYIKPFLRDIDVVANNEKFIGIKHFFVEIFTALGNLILRDSKTHTIATYVDFNYDGKFNISTGQGIENAISNGFKEKLKPGIEDKYKMKE